ncbi:MAG: murein hydrolase activator EnvC family protein [Burkholderiales bacterium]
MKLSIPRAFRGEIARKRAWMLVFCLAILACALRVGDVYADANKAALDDLRERIERLNRELAKSEESRNEVADQLRTTERAISEYNRALLNLARDQSQLNRDLQAVEKEIVSLRASIGRESRLRDELIRQQYMHGNTDALRLMLSGEDVSAVERQLAYLGYVAKARAGVIERLKLKVEQLAVLQEQVREKQAALLANAEAQKKARATLVAERANRQSTLNRIRADINRNRREVGKLKADENRLTRLIERIAQELARKREPPSATPGDARRKPLPTPRERRAGQPVEVVADAGLAGRAFASLRGKLKLPVRGELSGRFGAAREEGGATWKGLFIRAAKGQPVRTVADGRVVYADWLRGYGNLLIIDHGAGYLSLYGHNETLDKQVGDRVSAGEAIASVGSTGGAEESGVYFELRQDGKPFDPMRWVGR